MDAMSGFSEVLAEETKQNKKKQVNCYLNDVNENLRKSQ